MRSYHLKVSKTCPELNVVSLVTIVTDAVEWLDYLESQIEISIQEFPFANKHKIQ